MPASLAEHEGLQSLDLQLNALSALPPAWLDGGLFGTDPYNSSLVVLNLGANRLQVGVLLGIFRRVFWLGKEKKLVGNNVGGPPTTLPW